MACIPGITESLRGGVRMTILLTGAAGQLGQALRQPGSRLEGVA
jgi:hypothetical protein